MERVNYHLIEFLHVCFFMRDTLEYCQDNVKISRDLFEKRKEAMKNILAENTFVNKYFTSNSQEGKDFYGKLMKYVDEVYNQERYFTFNSENILVPDDSIRIELVQQEAGIYQTFFDVITGFHKAYSEKNEVDATVTDMMIVNDEYYRVYALSVIFTELFKEDLNYRKAAKDSQGKDEVQMNFILNNLRAYIGCFKFVQEKYSGTNQDVIEIFEETFHLLQKMDGTIKIDKPSDLPDLINQNTTKIYKLIANYEKIWQETYRNMLDALRQEQENKKAN